MMFDPTPHQEIIINRSIYTFDEHPVAKHMVYALAGGKSTVYRLSDQHGQCYALKVFRAGFQSPRIETVASLLKPYNLLPGLKSADFRVLSPRREPELIANHPEFAYAILMPWLSSLTCTELFLEKMPIVEQQALKLAARLAQVLHILKSNGLAHCDVSSSNVLVCPGTSEVSLVGLDNMFGLRFPEPVAIPAGSPGFAHPKSRLLGQWCEAGDRFSGAVLIGTLIGWSSPEVREASCRESYFTSNEIGQMCDRWTVLHRNVNHRNTEIGKLFEETWFSESLQACPCLGLWRDSLCVLADQIPR